MSTTTTAWTVDKEAIVATGESLASKLDEAVASPELRLVEQLTSLAGRMARLKNISATVADTVADAMETKRAEVCSAAEGDLPAVPGIVVPVAPLLLQSKFISDDGALFAACQASEATAREAAEKLAAADADPRTGLVVTAESEWQGYAAERDQAWCHLAQLSAVRVAGLQSRATALAESLHRNDPPATIASPPSTASAGAGVPAATAAAWTAAKGIAARLAAAEATHHATTNAALEECLSQLDAANALAELASNNRRRRAVGEQLVAGLQTTHEELAGVNKHVRTAKRELVDLLGLDDDDIIDEDELAEDEQDEPAIRKAKKAYAKHKSAKSGLLRRREQWFNDIVALSERVAPAAAVSGAAEGVDAVGAVDAAPTYDMPDLPARARQLIRQRIRKSKLSGKALREQHMLCLLERNQVSCTGCTCKEKRRWV